MNRSKKRAQAWFGDFVIGMTIFTIVLFVYFGKINSLQNEQEYVRETILADSTAITTTVVSAGYPDSWNNVTVQRIGITENDYNINGDKVLNFHALPYGQARELLGTFHEFFIYWTDENGTVVNVDGVCGIGSPLINATYDLKSAYYYYLESDSFLKDFMINNFEADVYQRGVAGSDLSDLVAAINSYQFIVFEHPQLQQQDLTNYQTQIEDWVANDGLFMMSGNVITPQFRTLLGAEMIKKSGQAVTDREARVVADDEFLSLVVGENITFAQAYYMLDDSIAEGNLTNVSIFNADDQIALARWEWENGSVFFFSDFDADYLEDDFVGVVEKATLRWVNARCLPIDLSGIMYDNLVATDRYLAYESKTVRMVTYVWD